jgi:OmpA family
LTFSTEEMPSSGDVFVSDNVSGPDLMPSDFDGLCFIHGASYYAGMGASRNMLFFGIPWTKVPTQILNGIASNLIDIKSYLLGPVYQIYKAAKFYFSPSDDLPSILRPLVGEAKGVIIAQGAGLGPASTIGGSLTFGYMSSESEVMPWEIDLRGSDPMPVGFKNASQDTSTMQIPSDVLFGFDKDQIGSGDDGLEKAEASLNFIASLVILMRPRTLFTEGHTDSVGGPKYNQGLSERRARAVRNWLLSKGKLTGVPITPIGFGLTRPGVVLGEPGFA